MSNVIRPDWPKVETQWPRIKESYGRDKWTPRPVMHRKPLWTALEFSAYCWTVFLVAVWISHAILEAMGT